MFAGDSQPPMAAATTVQTRKALSMESFYQIAEELTKPLFIRRSLLLGHIRVCFLWRCSFSGCHVSFLYRVLTTPHRIVVGSTKFAASYSKCSFLLRLANGFGCLPWSNSSSHNTEVDIDSSWGDGCPCSILRVERITENFYRLLNESQPSEQTSWVGVQRSSAIINENRKNGRATRWSDSQSGEFSILADVYRRT